MSLPSSEEAGFAGVVQPPPLRAGGLLRAKYRFLLATAILLITSPLGLLTNSFPLLAGGLSFPLWWAGLPSAALSFLSLARYRAYAALFLLGSFADYYVRLWQRCYEYPVPNIEVSGWLLALATAIDCLQYPMAKLRLAALDWAYDASDKPLLVFLLHPLVLAVFPLCSAALYTWLFTALEQRVQRRLALWRNRAPALAI